MNAATRIAVLAAVALASLGANQAQAADTHHAMVNISNPTAVNITYQFRWGSGEWKTFVLAPGEVRSHYWRYDYVNQNASPTPYVRFDADLSADVNFREYRLEAYAVPFKDDRFAKKYGFRTAGLLLDLVAE